MASHPVGSPHDYDAVSNDLADAHHWCTQHGHRLLVGEFGTIRCAPAADREEWTRHVRSECERLGVPWCYWDLTTRDFGLLDAATRAANAALCSALLD